MKTSILLPILALWAAAFLPACDKDTAGPPPALADTFFLRGTDASLLPALEARGVVFKDAAGQPADPLVLLRGAGLNTIRLRVWHGPAPADAYAGTEAVAAFAERIRAAGLKVWLTLHYSDYWADPGKQNPPAAWQGLPYEVLKDSLYRYTRALSARIRPDFIQIGNEVNNGMLWPQGDANSQAEQFRGLMAAGAKAVRDASPNTRIILQYAGIQGAPAFFLKFGNLDHDLIGLSYYHWWHGHDMDSVRLVMADLRERHQKPVLIAETSYPFSLGWADATHNVFGDAAKLLPDYAATPFGQQGFLKRLRTAIAAAEGQGLCYWGGEWVAFPGPQSDQDGSPWENQALFDFEHRLLPAAGAIGE